MRKRTRGNWLLLSLTAVTAVVFLAHCSPSREAEVAARWTTDDVPLITIDVPRPCRPLSVDEFVCDEVILRRP